MGKKLSDIFDIFRHIQVYALVGESGTGKSFRSKLLAEEYGIHAIIDDGLLIQDEKIVACTTRVYLLSWCYGSKESDGPSTHLCKKR